MPNRWESSGRPLFVKTIYVNGNRHAILSQEDPLLRSRVSFFKKASRPNSCLSFDSDVSVTTSESRGSNTVGKERNSRVWKDLSSELQDCLVKLRLANGEKTEMVSNPEEPKVESSSSLKRQKWARNRKKKMHNGRDRFRENEPEDGHKDRYRYVYNYENTKGKKNYCFVKISSEPQGTIFDSVCDSSDSLKPDSKNFVISAAFHNLVMSSYKTNQAFRNKSDYFFPFEDSSEIYWNNYLTRTYYNSLSERVIQWLDLTKKRKRMQNLEPKESFNEKTILDKRGRKRGSVPRKESTEDDVESEVKVEQNVETALSVQKLIDLEDDRSIIKMNEKARFNYTEGECEGSGWKRKINQQVDVDSDSVTVTRRCEKNGRDYANDFEIATQEFTERNQKSIDKVNVTRMRPISVRELSPQQQKETSPEQIAWSSARDIGRPQLHIFIPMMPSKELSEESMSEHEPQITEV